MRLLLVEHITPNPLANLPIEQRDRGIDGPSRSRPRLLDEGMITYICNGSSCDTKNLSKNAQASLRNMRWIMATSIQASLN
jgi:hypothetical protein